MRGTLKGRVVYIEPNDFRNQLGATYGSGDNVYWQPEDLSMAVDLQVIVPDRNSCGKDIWKDINLNVSNTWTSFFRGTELNNDEPYLTDSFTDISYQEITQSGAGSKEALGIKSIDIQFDSHFYPVVKMRLIDVRGASLMMPAEHNSSHREKTCQEFFSAIFHFPYPRFALSVKGFYGSRVTFMLAVNDFQSSFNAQTGNFEAEITFIGHMYGLYTDIPMACILVAPYIGKKDGTEGDYWSKQVKDNIFTFSDGTRIPTFKQFSEEYKKMADNFRNEYVGNEEKYSNISSIEEKRKEISLLEKLQAEYDEIIKNVSEKNKESKVVTSSDSTYKLFFLKDKKINLPSIANFISTYDSYSECVSIADKVELPRGFDKDIENEYIQWGNDGVEILPPIIKEEKDADNKSVYRLDEAHQLYPLVKNDADVKETITSSPDFAGKCVFYLPYDSNFKSKILERKNTLDNEVNAKLSEASSELCDLAKKVIGFVPSIENVIRMTFAHIDAFMHEYYNLLSNIKKNGEKTRKSSSFKLNGITTDVDARDGKFTFPPFTGFYQKDTKTDNVNRKYPGEIPEFKNFEEVAFIEKIYNAIDDVNSSIDEAETQNTEENIEKKEEPWAPLSNLDVLENENPYKKFSKGNSGSYVDALVWFAFKRFYAAGLATSKYEANANSFPTEAEVENFWNAQGKTLSNISETELTKIRQEIEEITKYTENDDSNKNPIVSKILETYNSKNKTSCKTIKELSREKILEIDAGHYVISEEKIQKLPDVCKKNLTMNYDPDDGSNFLGIVYANGDFTHKDEEYVLSAKIDTKHRNQCFKDAIKDNERFTYPVLYFIDNSATVKDVPSNYFTIYDGNISKPEPWGFLASFLGTDNVYRFEKDESSIVKMRKVEALFLGCMISNSKKFEKFPISSNGYFTPKDESILLGLGGSTWQEKINGFTIKQLVERDTNKGLEKFYDKWVSDTGGVNHYGELANDTKKATFVFGKKKITGYTENTLKNTKSDYKTEMVKLASDTVVILNVKYAPGSGYSTAPLLLSRLKKFLSDVLDKVNKAAQNNDNVSEGASEGSTNEIANPGEKSYDTMQKKSQMYYTLKNLYDKWLACYDQERFKLRTPQEDSDTAFKKNNGKISDKAKVHEVQNFMYIDTFYNDIGDIFMVDPKTIMKVVDRGGRDRSVMQFIADIAQENKLLFVPLPVFTNMYDADSIASVFTPQSLYGNNEFLGATNNARGIGNTYVFMYTHESSHHTSSRRNKNTVEYLGDALDFNDEEIPIPLSAIKPGEKGYTIPAFGVTFGKQDQMYFKNISVSMANPKETDVSIANRFILANNERNGDSRISPNTVGQNLYSIYSNRSYECTVDMMGCANIMPLMYFQLNNIPMFRGAYRIYSVKHHIENGSMTTTFAGVRISKNTIPIETNAIDIETLLNKIRNTSPVDDDSIQHGDSPALLKMGAITKGYRKEDVRDKNGEEVIFNTVDAINTLRKGNIYSSKGYIYPYRTVNFEGKYSVCATCVKAAVKAGFEDHTHEFASLWDSGYHGYYCRNILMEMHFGCVYKWEKANSDVKDGYKYNGGFLPGDVVCSQYLKKDGTPAEHGHVAIFDGTNFISDCLQTGNYKWGNASVNTIIYELYRFNGKTVYPENELVLQIEKDEDIKIYNSNSGWEIGNEIKAASIAMKHPSTVENCNFYFIAQCNEKIKTYEITNITGGSTIDKSKCLTRMSDKKTVRINLCEVSSSLGCAAKLTLRKA